MSNPPGSRRAIPADGRGAVVTIGTFDGIHRGHQEVLAEIVRRGRASGRRSILVTFDPHPLEIVRPEAAPKLLTTIPEKKPLLAQFGLEYAVFLRFDETLRQYSARRFVEEILLGRFGMSELVIGYDHGFGRGREGSVETLQELGAEHGFTVDVVEAVSVSTHPISSTVIRSALADGDVRAAARGLGRPYALWGTVVRGDGRGHQLGFPTANLRLPDPRKLTPLEGIYAAYGVLGADRIPGLLHLGPRPTFPGALASVELYLFDWSGDLYGQTVGVELIERIRGVMAFDSAEALVEQMRDDESAGRKLLMR